MWNFEKERVLSNQVLPVDSLWKYSNTITEKCDIKIFHISKFSKSFSVYLTLLLTFYIGKEGFIISFSFTLCILYLYSIYIWPFSLMQIPSCLVILHLVWYFFLEAPSKSAEFKSVTPSPLNLFLSLFLFSLNAQQYNRKCSTVSGSWRVQWVYIS